MTCRPFEQGEYKRYFKGKRPQPLCLMLLEVQQNWPIWRRKHRHYKWKPESVKEQLQKLRMDKLHIWWRDHKGSTPYYEFLRKRIRE
jgi:hypothetical protein